MHSRQKTGTNEEVTDHIQRLDDFLLHYESLSKDDSIKRIPKEKLEKKRVDGQKLRESSMKNMVKKQTLEDQGSDSGLEEGTENGSQHTGGKRLQRKAPKNQ